MKLLNFRKFFVVGGFVLLVLTSAAYETRAQGRGRDESKWDKKCAKFVNCHDASEGRVDGRGPRRGDDDDRWNWRRHRRDRDDDRSGDDGRRHHRNRRYDRDDYRRDRDRNWDRDRTWTRRGR